MDWTLYTAHTYFLVRDPLLWEKMNQLQIKVSVFQKYALWYAQSFFVPNQLVCGLQISFQRPHSTTLHFLNLSSVVAIKNHKSKQNETVIYIKKKSCRPVPTDWESTSYIILLHQRRATIHMPRETLLAEVVRDFSASFHCVVKCFSWFGVCKP